MTLREKTETEKNSKVLPFSNSESLVNVLITLGFSIFVFPTDTSYYLIRLLKNKLTNIFKALARVPRAY